MDRTAEGRFASLDTLRGIAVMMVCLSHAPFFIPANGQGANWLAVPALGVGVDLFFAISGFVVALSLRNLIQRSGDLTFAVCAFSIRRLARIVPTAWLILLVLSSFAVFISRSFLPLADLVNAAAFTGNLHFGRCFGGGGGCGTGNLVQHFWSIALEMQFYLIAPLLFLMPVRILRIATLSVGFFGIFVARPWQSSMAWAFRFEALLLGFWIGREWLARSEWSWTRLVPALGGLELTGLLVVMTLLPRVMTGPLSGLGTVLVAAIAAWIVVRSALTPAAKAANLFQKIGRKLGAWSYGIYMVHPPIMIVVGALGISEWVGFSGATLVAFAAIIATGWWITTSFSDPIYRAACNFTDRHLQKGQTT